MANGMYYLTFVIAILVVTVGILKVAPIEPGHGFMVSKMNEYATVTPLRYIGIQLSGTGFRTLIAILEIAFGSLLAFGRNDWPVVAGFVALAISTNGLLCQVALREAAADFVAPIAIFIAIVVMIFGSGGLVGRRGKVHLS
ncbi:uncharacterized protein LOC129258495 [Lytechinus pictus]|uniref:uncharacterized protein LOC121413613 n=1 Tax=Lytechinus variegatus TaxID=7654 RepID=UPI001BB1F2CE|nr:uncharacterized protein LOC121413613 [Lytechinus variegatus]XP_054752729.1 uncharacterized protein LOC129258495 [Lytechinus pictus]